MKRRSRFGEITGHDGVKYAAGYRQHQAATIIDEAAMPSRIPQPLAQMCHILIKLRQFDHDRCAPEIAGVNHRIKFDTVQLSNACDSSTVTHCGLTTRTVRLLQDKKYWKFTFHPEFPKSLQGVFLRNDLFHGVNADMGPANKPLFAVGALEEVQHDGLRILQAQLGISVGIFFRQFLNPER